MGHFHAQDHVSAAGAEADVFLAALKDRSDRGSKSPSSVTAHSHAQGNSAAVNKETNGVTTYDHYDRSHEHLHSQPHTRSHLHLLNPFAVHSHAKGHEFGSTAEADADADALLAALKGRGHRGFNITLLGLLANIPLSTSKDLTGVYLNSAATVTAPGGEDGHGGGGKTPFSQRRCPLVYHGNILTPAPIFSPRPCPRSSDPFALPPRPARLALSLTVPATPFSRHPLPVSLPFQVGTHGGEWSLPHKKVSCPSRPCLLPQL
ncbi:hypothetical protein CF335_g7831 [Tilletia laevis]|nr:hypothetical protein CF335_g7831 [Tilletia laevis]